MDPVTSGGTTAVRAIVVAAGVLSRRRLGLAVERARPVALIGSAGLLAPGVRPAATGGVSG